LRSASTASCRARITPALATAFASAARGPSVRWHEAASDDLMEDVLAGRLDAAVVHSARSGTGLTVVPFFEDLLVAQLPADTAGHVEGEMAVRDLDGLRLLVSGPRHDGHDRRCLALLHDAGVRPRTSTRAYGATEVPPGHVALTGRALVAPGEPYAVITPRQSLRLCIALRERSTSPAIAAFIQRARSVQRECGWGFDRPVGDPAASPAPETGPDAGTG
jgi:DNA-binding transcriptional LysR family regulator